MVRDTTQMHKIKWCKIISTNHNWTPRINVELFTAAIHRSASNGMVLLAVWRDKKLSLIKGKITTAGSDIILPSTYYPLFFSAKHCNVQPELFYFVFSQLYCAGQCFSNASPWLALVGSKCLPVQKTFITKGISFLKSVGKRWIHDNKKLCVENKNNNHADYLTCLQFYHYKPTSLS
jgi:hypothetical protein